MIRMLRSSSGKFCIALIQSPSAHFTDSLGVVPASCRPARILKGEATVLVRALYTSRSLQASIGLTITPQDDLQPSLVLLNTKLRRINMRRHHSHAGFVKVESK
jgi:hypothetical protein